MRRTAPPGIEIIIIFASSNNDCTWLLANGRKEETSRGWNKVYVSSCVVDKTVALLVYTGILT